MLYMDLIRHAKTRWNLEKRLQGRQDIALSPRGIQDAGRWAGLLQETRYDRIVSSPMIRAHKTALTIARTLNIPVGIEPDLREQDFGLWEGRTLQELRQEFPGQVENQESRGWAFCPPRGESRQQVLDRVTAAVKKMVQAYNGRQLLVVTHSSVIKILINHILGRQFLPFEKPRNKDLLKPWHLHRVVWNDSQGRLQIDALNAKDLS